MKSRWVVVSAVIAAACLAWAGAATTESSPAPAAPAVKAESPQAAPATDPYLGKSPISTTAPNDRRPCTYYNQDCANGWDGKHCGPPGPYCLCSVYQGSYACVSAG